jgi:peptidoglycan/xylan/chitin deacetylase (PgdA/CDA1 family)
MSQRRSCILAYHSIDHTGSVISLLPHVFRAQMAELAQSGARVVPLPQILDVPGSVAITFDDGFRNFFEQAFPVLQLYRFPATVFVVSQYCGRRNDWPSQPAGIPSLELMSWSNVKEVAQGGISVGAHTLTHPYLSRLPLTEIEKEVSRSRTAIEDSIGRAVDTFAYPYGDLDPRVHTVVKDQFRLACGTTAAFVPRLPDSANLPRIDAYYLRSPLWFNSLNASYGTAYVAMRRWARGLRAIVRNRGRAANGDLFASSPQT